MTEQLFKPWNVLVYPNASRNAEIRLTWELCCLSQGAPSTPRGGCPLGPGIGAKLRAGGPDPGEFRNEYRPFETPRRCRRVITLSFPDRDILGVWVMRPAGVLNGMHA